MRKLMIIGAVLGGLIGIAVLFLINPHITEAVLTWQCPQPTGNCPDRMRTMGHIWSRNGDNDRARHWYGVAAEAGDAAAMFHLAWTYEHEANAGSPLPTVSMNVSGELDGTSPRVANTKNFALAFQWYRRSADKGFAPAQNNLGQMYLYGWGTTRNSAQAFRWYLAAARAGNPVGAMNVTAAYLIGAGVQRDHNEAKHWSKFKAADPNPADLEQLTLKRTAFFGSTLPVGHMIRAARMGKDATVAITPLKPDARVPKFEPMVQQQRPDSRTR